MRLNFHVGLLLLFCLVDVKSQITEIQGGNIYNNRAGRNEDSLGKIHKIFSKRRFGIGVGTAIPAGEYADKGEKGGLAEFGYAAGIKCLFAKSEHVNGD